MFNDTFLINQKYLLFVIQCKDQHAWKVFMISIFGSGLNFQKILRLQKVYFPEAYRRLPSTNSKYTRDNKDEIFMLLLTIFKSTAKL